MVGMPMIPDYLDVPIFPLPSVTFFPRTVLPLHIFEPRYREMVRSCIEGDRMIAVALLREGWQKEYFGNPPVFKMMGVGKIVDYVHLDNDCYDIVVEGLYRVQLVTEFEEAPFRTARVSVMQDQPIDLKREELDPLFRELSEICDELSELVPEYGDIIRTAWAANPHPAVTVDLLTAALVIDAYDRQSILSELDPIRRIKLVLIQLRKIVYQLTNKEIEEEVFEED